MTAMTRRMMAISKAMSFVLKVVVRAG